MSFELLAKMIACLLALGMIGGVVAAFYIVFRDVTQDTFEDYNDYMISVRRGVKEWEDHYPSIHKLNSMRKEYPALDSSFEKFKTSYDLVVNDWESKRIGK